MRCPDCNKFVAYDAEQEPEEQSDPELTDDQFSVDVRRVLTCENCGTELKDTTFTLECAVDITHPALDADPAEEKYNTEVRAMIDACDHEWDISVEYEPTTQTQTGTWSVAARASVRKEPVRVRRGDDEIETKIIKPGDHVWEQWRPRYYRTSYGVDAHGEATCSKCQATATIEASDSCPASGMDELT